MKHWKCKTLTMTTAGRHTKRRLTIMIKALQFPDFEKISIRHRSVSHKMCICSTQVF